jgi:3-phytase
MFSFEPVSSQIPFIQHTLATESVRTDPDDPAIWIHSKQPELSLLICTDKVARIGGLYVFNLDGKIVQHIDNIDRPNNVDVEYDFRINQTVSIDLVVLTERGQKRLRIFTIDPLTRQLSELTGSNTSVFTDSQGDFSAPMGIGLYKRPSDGTIYAIVSRKSGPKRDYLAQYELIWNGRTIDLKWVRFFGDFEGAEIESIIVDDQLGLVYYSDEGYGIRKYNVDPNHSQKEQIDFINTTGLWQGDSEGLALYATSNTNGYLIMTDQISNGSIFHIYERQGKNMYVKSVRTLADSTDGIEATSQRLNENFPRGLMITMNEIAKNFLIYDWRQIEKEFDFIRNDMHPSRISVICLLLEFCFVYLSFSM